MDDRIEPACSSCFFSAVAEIPTVPTGTRSLRFCRRYPPTPIGGEGGKIHMVNPQVADNHYCGEFGMYEDPRLPGEQAPRSSIIKS